MEEEITIVLNGLSDDDKENKKKMLFALAVGLGSTAASYEELTADEIAEANKLYKTSNIQKKVETGAPIDEHLVQALVVASLKDTTEYFKIVNPGDGKTCDACKEWIGQIVTVHGEDPRYRTVDDFIKSGGLHTNCRCTLQKISVKKPSEKELASMAMNAEPLKDTLVYRGFIDEALDPDVEYDYDDTLVMLTPLGEFVGSTPDGKTTKEIIDEEAVIKMAMQTEEILLDKDHASMRPVEERNTEAMGWISGLKAITNLGAMNGLYGIIKWTGEGKKLAQERVYRFLSPVFQLDENGKAVKLINVALTNRPNLKMPPIINSEAEKEELSITKIKKDTDNMNKDELNALVVEMVKKALEDVNKAKLSAEISKEVAEEAAKQKIIDESLQTETKEEVKNECISTKEEVKNEEMTKEEVTKEEMTKEEVANEEVPEKKDEEKEVIKAEVLNSSPITVGTSVNGMEAWRNLKGEEFFKYLRAHPEIK